VQTFAQAHPIIRPLADYGQWVRSALAGQLHSSVQPFTTEECAT